MEPGPGVFVFTLGGSLMIALLSIFYRACVASVQNPVVSLRYEG